MIGLSTWQQFSFNLLSVPNFVSAGTSALCLRTERSAMQKYLWFWCHDLQGVHSCWSYWRAGECVSEVRPPGVKQAQSWRCCLVGCSGSLHAWLRGSREPLWALVRFAGALPPVPELPLPCHAFLFSKSSLWTGSCDGAALRINHTMVATWLVAQSLALCLAVSAGGLRVSLSLVTCAWSWAGLSSLLLLPVPWAAVGSWRAVNPGPVVCSSGCPGTAPCGRGETSMRVGLFWQTKVHLNPPRYCLEMVSLKSGCWVMLCVVPSKC